MAGEAASPHGDAASFRAVFATVLRGRGYHVLVASNADEALRLATVDGQIALLLTDVVMPGLSGPDLAEQVRALAPLVRVLFVSGYTEDTIVHRGVLASTVSFLAKPFSPDVLAERVREELDAVR
jgi:two-component system, cell cycle sensor histidine kinase and response regulator CckA